MALRDPIFSGKFDRNYLLQLETHGQDVGPPDTDFAPVGDSNGQYIGPYAQFRGANGKYIGPRGGEILKIRPPLTVEFDITRTYLPSSGTSFMKVYNLNPHNRNQLRLDVSNYGKIRKLKFEAGYQKNMGLAFEGNYTAAWSVREGNNDVTYLECFDGGFAQVNAYSNVTLSETLLKKSVIKKLIQDLKPFGVKLGAIGESYAGSLTRGNCYSGPTTELLHELTNGQFFIDNGIGHALSAIEVIAGKTSIINSQSGLLASPVRQNYYVDLEMLLAPELIVGQVVTLDISEEDPIQRKNNLNTKYKIMTLSHRGVISDAICGEAITHVRLQPVGANPPLIPFEADNTL